MKTNNDKEKLRVFPCSIRRDKTILIICSSSKMNINVFSSKSIVIICLNQSQYFILRKADRRETFQLDSIKS